MTAPEVLVLAAAALAFLLAAQSWPRPRDEAHTPPPSRPRPSGAPYRAQAGAAIGDDETPAASGATLAPEDAARFEALADAWADSRTRADGPAMIESARRVLLAAPCDLVRVFAMHVLAHGQALTGDAFAAVTTLESIAPASARTALGGRAWSAWLQLLQIEIYRRARRHRRALDVLREALEEDDDPDLAALAGIVEEESVRWRRAVRELDDPAAVPAAEDYGLVREAGRLKGRNDDAARVGERLYAEAPDPDLAWEIACCWARARDRQRASAWLVRAGEAGSRHVERLEAEELAFLRGGEGYERVIAALGG